MPEANDIRILRRPPRHLPHRRRAVRISACTA